ncbi:MAG TPA: DUF72 domain-containing protein [Candidatus Krumholzibacteria bacterium]|nr:DUF72 domain-containing protein [Candidatus Krumholzibacteria bacterium]
MNLYAGTSGYSYKEWKGFFYPEKIPNDEMLAFYGGKLPAVEINNTFYRLPKREVLANWAEQVPADFRFAIKAAQKISHMKRLKNAAEETDYLMDVVGELGEKLGVVFFQLPPNFKQDLDRLGAFLETLPEKIPVAFEFRHSSWFEDPVYELLKKHNVALCLADADDDLEVPLVRTADWGYLRLRRPGYAAEELQQWRTWVNSQKWKSAFVFFKHEDAGAGPKMATEFLRLDA